MKALFMLFVGIALASNARQQSPDRSIGGVPGTRITEDKEFPDVPENHWAYEVLARCKKDDLLVGWTDRFIRGYYPHSAGDFADEAVYIVVRYNSLAAQLTPGGRQYPNIAPDAPTNPSEQKVMVAELLRVEPEMEKLVKGLALYMPVFADPKKMLRYLQADRGALEKAI